MHPRDADRAAAYQAVQLAGTPCCHLYFPPQPPKQQQDCGKGSIVLLPHQPISSRRGFLCRVVVWVLLIVVLV